MTGPTGHTGESGNIILPLNNVFTGTNNFTQNVSCSVAPVSGTDLINLNYLNTFPPPSSVMLYLTQSASPSPAISTYNLLGNFEDGLTQSSIPQTISTLNTYTFVSAFANSIEALKMGSFIPNGLWDMNIFANCATLGDIGYINILFRMFQIDISGNETQVGSDSSVFTITNVAPIYQQCICSIGVPYTDLTNSVNFVVKVFASNTNSNPHSFTTYYEDGATCSHMHTSLGVYVPISLLGTTNTWTASNIFKTGIDVSGSTTFINTLPVYNGANPPSSATQLVTKSYADGLIMSGPTGPNGSNGAAGVTGYTGATGASPWIISENNMYYTSGNVAIGKTIPLAALDISGNVFISNGSLAIGTQTISTNASAAKNAYLDVSGYCFFSNIQEKITLPTTGTSTAYTLDYSKGAVFSLYPAATANYSLNVINLPSITDTSRSYTICVLNGNVTTSGTTFYATTLYGNISAVQGPAITLKYNGGAASISISTSTYTTQQICLIYSGTMNAISSVSGFA